MAEQERKSIADQLFDTKFQSKVASEFWLRLNGRDYRLVGKEVRLGRALDNDIVLEDKSCSRYHARLRLQSTAHGYQVILEDLNSRNGVRVNGQKIQKAVLANQARIEIGDLTGEFLFRGKDEAHAGWNQASSEDLYAEVTGAGQSDLIEAPSLKTRVLALFQSFQNLPPKMRLLLVGFAPLLLLSIFVLIQAALVSFQGQVVIPKSQAAVISEACLPQNQSLETVSPAAFERCIEQEDLGLFTKAKSCLGDLPRNEKVCTALQRVETNQKQMAQSRYDAGIKAMQFHYYETAVVNFQEVLLIADEDAEIRAKADQALRDAQRSLMKPR